MADTQSELAFLELLWNEIQELAATGDAEAYKRIITLYGERRGTLQFQMQEFERTMMTPLDVVEREASDRRRADVEHGQDLAWGVSYLVTGPGEFTCL